MSRAGVTTRSAATAAVTESGRATVRAVYAGHLVAILAESGVPHGRILSGTGLKLDDLKPANAGIDASRITFAQQLLIYRNAVARYSARDLGIRLGQRIRLSDHGVFGFAVQSSRNLAQALRVMVRFVAVAGPLFNIEVRADSRHVSIEMHEMAPLDDVLPVAADEMLTVLATQLLAQTEPATRAASVTVPYAPGDTNALAKLLGCRPTRHAGPTTVTLEAADMERPFRLSDEETAALCEARCAEMLERLGAESDLVEVVRRLLVEDPRRYRSLDALAARLHMSGRTLRRRLADSGASFRTIRDDVSRVLALDYLQHTDLAVDDVADLLGYADVPNFYRAFRRWTGRSPAEARHAS